MFGQLFSFVLTKESVHPFSLLLSLPQPHSHAVKQIGQVSFPWWNIVTHGWAHSQLSGGQEGNERFILMCKWTWDSAQQWQALLLLQVHPYLPLQYFIPAVLKYNRRVKCVYIQIVWHDKFDLHTCVCQANICLNVWCKDDSHHQVYESFHSYTQLHTLSPVGSWVW